MAKKDGFLVQVDDNFHYQDTDHRRTLGTVRTREAAARACMEIVDACLEELHKAGMTAEGLYIAYTMFGDDPFIADPSCHFSAWEYARRRAVEMCSAPPHGGES